MEKIIVVDNSIVFTGALKSILAVCSGLNDRFEFSFVLNTTSTVKNVVREYGFHVDQLPLMEVSKTWRTIFYFPMLFINAVRMLHILDEQKANILHVNDIYNMLGIVCKMLRPRLKLVQHVRLLRSSYIGQAYPVFAWFVRRSAERIVCVSNAVVREFVGNVRTRRIYDALKVEECYLPKDYTRLNGCRFLYVGNYICGKGHDIAIEAFSQVATQLPDATLRFVGVGEDGSLDASFVERLKLRSAGVGLAGRIFFAGGSKDIEQEMKCSDIVLNFSESESFSMVCLEALAYGMPLIASDCGGPREIVDDMVNGILVPNRDNASGAAAMLRLAKNPSLAERLGREGYNSVRLKFDPIRSADELAAVYCEVSAA